jgi:hypothetical protein
MTMRFLIAALSIAGLLFSADAALADKRVAFVVGNSAYKNVAPLPNPAIDAKSMAKVLRNVGFDVVEGSNLTRDKMTERLLEFGKKAQGADVALFFYAGHGMAVNGTNYLLPVDADIKSEMDIKLGSAINVDLTLEQTMADAKVKLVFLDACRDNPFAGKIKPKSATRSLSVAVDPATFSTEADQTSEDQIGLDRNQRRDVQRRLTGLGFDTKATGKFDDATRAVIMRWQAARGYPKTGFLNTLEHKALLSEIVSTRVVASSDDSDEETVHHSRRSGGGGGGGGHYRRGGGGGLFGGMMGGLFGRR